MTETLCLLALLAVFCGLVVIAWMLYSASPDEDQDAIGDVPTISQFYHRWEDRL